MPAPNLTFSVTRNEISPYLSAAVTFSSDVAYSQFECRATKAGAEYGVGKGNLIASFSSTPANTQRTFEIYDEYLLSGDGEYRISLYAYNGAWNDNHLFIPAGFSGLKTASGEKFLCER